MQMWLDVVILVSAIYQRMIDSKHPANPDVVFNHISIEVVLG